MKMRDVLGDLWGPRGGEWGVGGEYDQYTLSTCMKFSST